MVENDRSLTAKQRQAIGLMCTELSLASVAKQVGCGEATLRRWRKRPAFRTELRRQLDATFEDGTRLLTAAQRNVLTELLTLALKADNPALRSRTGLGLEAALTRRRELLLLNDLAQRVDALEAAEDDEADAGAAGEQD